ncbi:MAG: FliM/FliN family flagellar motor switch protein [Pseudomonadota bacterium]
MNLAHNFTPARPLAQHCRELTERGPRPEERAEHLAAWRRDVAREVAQDMTDLLSGTKLEAHISEPESLRGEAVFERIGAVAANCLLRCGGDGQTVLLSLPVATAIALTDRSFGGVGEPVSEPATALPRSVALLIERAARTIAQAIARVSVGGADMGEPQGDVIVRSESASRLKPFTPLSECVWLTLDLSAPDGITWSARIAMPAERLDTLLPGLGSADAPAGGDDAQAESDREAFGAVPLSLEAVLAEFELSLSQLDKLSPGDRIPLALARDIPLRLGSQLVGLGHLGTLEDRMALKLTSVANSPQSGAQEAPAEEPVADVSPAPSQDEARGEGVPA